MPTRSARFKLGLLTALLSLFALPLVASPAPASAAPTTVAAHAAKALPDITAKKVSKGKVRFRNGESYPVAVCYGRYGYDPQMGPCFKLRGHGGKHLLKTKLKMFSWGAYKLDKDGKPTGPPIRDGYLLRVQK